MRHVRIFLNLWLAFSIAIFVSMCVPPGMYPEEKDRVEQAQLDSLREVRCPRLMSSAAEYYRNQDWEATVRIYREIDELSCYEFDPVLAPPEEVYLYYAIAHEYLGRFEKSEEVLLKGLQTLPGNIDLRKRLAYSYKKQEKFVLTLTMYKLLSLMQIITIKRGLHMIMYILIYHIAKRDVYIARSFFAKIGAYSFFFFY